MNEDSAPPVDETLKDIAEDHGNEAIGRFEGTPKDFVDLLEEAWDWNYGQMFVEEYNDSWLNRYWEVNLVTGGWSANEDVIAELEQTWFHMLFWESIHRGGSHIYRVPSAKWDQVWELGEMP